MSRKTQVECASSVRRQSRLLFRTTGSSRIAASQGSRRSSLITDHTSPDGVFDCTVQSQAPQPFRSYHSIETSLPISRRVATALPRTIHCTRRAAIMSEPSLETPLAVPREFYSGHAPTLRLFTEQFAQLLPHGRPDHAPGCQSRRPQCFLR